METKVCRKCWIEKPVVEFSFANRAKGWLRYQCRECDKHAVRALYHSNASVKAKAKARSAAWQKANPKTPEQHRIDNLKYNFGLSEADYEAMRTAQGNRCAICQSDDPGRKSGKWANGHWHVDHCHETGRVRGLLCHSCNVRLGAYERLMKDRGHDWLENYLRD